MANTYHTLRLILGDQLNAEHSWFHQKNDQTLYVIAELKQETDYVQHHLQKLLAFFAAMQAFAKALKAAGHQVLHLTLDDTVNSASLPELLHQLITQFDIQAFAYQQPDEYRVHQQLTEFCQTLNIQYQKYETEHFYLPHADIANFFQTGKSHRLEMFYRKMRKQFSILMANDKPLGEQWNFDQNNRASFKADDLAKIPKPLCFANDVQDIIARLKKHEVSSIGNAETHLLWPINRSQSRELLHYFCRYCLPNFGRFQDAMTSQLRVLQQDHSWSLYHSRLSFSLNSKMLSPHYVLGVALEYFYQSNGAISLAQIEGFVRQILGWREFVRGIYWQNMPQYGQLNYLKAQRQLPEWFWTGNTKMACLAHAIKQSLNFGYAHHIQRLMVTGNFCLLTGIAPEQVDAWYLGIYVDALQWVELPNTRGMSQFADGGLVGSKAYAASGNYINKMSDYCHSCYYQVKQQVGANACPLNALYWHFMVQHQAQLTNPRTRMVYTNWHKKPAQQQQQILQHAEHLLSQLELL